MSDLWLEVSNVRTLSGGNQENNEDPISSGNEDQKKNDMQVEVQLKADRGDREPTWWPVRDTASEADAAATAREIFRAMDSKRIVLARIKPGSKSGSLVVDCIRIQFTDSGSR